MTFGRVPVFSEAWGEKTLAAMREYIETLELALDDDSMEMEVETLSGEPFCGCSDCYEREGYLMMTKLVLEGHEAGEVRLSDVE
jgi:hypothetical protein